MSTQSIRTGFIDQLAASHVLRRVLIMLALSFSSLSFDHASLVNEKE
jgi:hypothetical protein